MLPVITGFIFPDGTILETGGEGHCKCAYRYIVEHNLQEYFKDYTGECDDFLIERLGAIKVCHYRSQHFLYMPNYNNWYYKKIKEIYIKRGYKILYLRSNIIMDVFCFMTSGEYSYNATVVKDVNENGKIIYKYNPKRIGD